jgi:hypothetical protein
VPDVLRLYLDDNHFAREWMIKPDRGSNGVGIVAIGAAGEEEADGTEMDQI